LCKTKKPALWNRTQKYGRRAKIRAPLWKEA
jgi:hypothetical protein